MSPRPCVPRAGDYDPASMTEMRATHRVPERDELTIESLGEPAHDSPLRSSG